MFELLGKDTQGKRFGLEHRFALARAISQNARQLRNLSDPAAVFLALGLDAQMHDGGLFDTTQPAKDRCCIIA